MAEAPGLEAAWWLWDHSVRTIDFLADVVTVHDPVQEMIAARTYRVQALADKFEGMLLDKMYDLVTKGRNV